MAKGQWLPGASVHTTDLPDVSKSVEQRLFIRQHRPLHCRGSTAVSVGTVHAGRQLPDPRGPGPTPHLAYCP